MIVDRCPLKMVPADIWELLEFADLYAKGLPPIAGGTLDQAKGFTQACSFIWREEEYWKAKLDPTGSRT